MNGTIKWSLYPQGLNELINKLIKSDALTIHRRPISQSTDCARGKVGFDSGLHIWEIVWTSNQRGTHAVVGIGTEKAQLRKVISFLHVFFRNVTFFRLAIARLLEAAIKLGDGIWEETRCDMAAKLWRQLASPG